MLRKLFLQESELGLRSALGKLLDLFVNNFTRQMEQLHLNHLYHHICTDTSEKTNELHYQFKEQFKTRQDPYGYVTSQLQQEPDEASLSVSLRQLIILPPSESTFDS